MKILIVAAEDSASLHAEAIIDALKKLNPHYDFVGAASDFLENKMEIIVKAKNLSFVGVEEPSKLIKIAKAYRLLKKTLRNADGVILFDYPGLNLKLAKKAKSLGLPVCYYVAPQVWAWWTSRVKKIKKYVDALVCLFPFEEEFFRKHGINAKFFGHPLVQRLRKYKSNKEKLILFLPGSRESEIKNLLAPMIEAAKLCKRHLPNFRCAFIEAPSVNIKDKVKEFEVIPAAERYIYMSKAWAAVSASGTATLELAIFETPTVVVYKVSPFTYFVGRHLVKVNFLSIVNIIATREVFPEILQEKVTAQNIYSTLSRISVDFKTRENIVKACCNMIKKLEREEPYIEAARFFDEILRKNT